MCICKPQNINFYTDIPNTLSYLYMSISEIRGIKEGKRELPCFNFSLNLLNIKNHLGYSTFHVMLSQVK